MKFVLLGFALGCAATLAYAQAPAPIFPPSAAATAPIQLPAAGSQQPTSTSTFAQPYPNVNLGTFVLQGAVDGDGAKQGASFSYTKQDKEDFFQSKFAAFYLTPAYTGFSNNKLSQVYGIFGVDGQLGTRSKSANDFLNIRTQASYLYGFGGLSPDGLPDPFASGGGTIFLRAGPLYQATQDFKIQDLMFEAAATYSSPSLGIGAYRCFATACGPGDIIEYYFEPRFSTQIGGNVFFDKTAKSIETKSTIARLIPAISAGLSFPQAAKLLNVYSTTISFDEAAQYLPVYGKMKNDITVAANVQFVPGISLGLSYETGSTAPTFQHDDIILLALKVKLGVLPFFSQ